MSEQSELAPPRKPLGEAIDRLATITARLRDPDRGCPWDIAQDFASIAPYTIEEAYEVADACKRGDMAALEDELGDLQLQLVYHACMAEEAGAFDLTEVIAGIADKMVRRHPHVFGDGGESAGWEAIKAEERLREGIGGALAGVARALPALLRAQKLQQRAAGTGFDWPDPGGPRAKVYEELAEVEAAKGAAVAEEIGDLLFATVNWARRLGVDCEAALRAANDKFELRFHMMEEFAGNAFNTLSLDEKESLWERAKAPG